MIAARNARSLATTITWRPETAKTWTVPESTNSRFTLGEMRERSPSSIALLSEAAVESAGSPMPMRRESSRLIGSARRGALKCRLAPRIQGVSLSCRSTDTDESQNAQTPSISTTARRHPRMRKPYPKSETTTATASGSGQASAPDGRSDARASPAANAPQAAIHGFSQLVIIMTK